MKDFLIATVVASFCVGFVYAFCRTKKVTKEEFDEFVKNSYFIKINCQLGTGLQVCNGNEVINNGLKELGFETYESLLAFFIKNGFDLKEHNEKNNEYHLQRIIK